MAIHNRLEYFNELCLILMQYMMIFFIAGSTVDPEEQWVIGSFSMVLLGFVFFVNVVALMYLMVCRCMWLWKLRKSRLAMGRRRRRGALYKSSDSLRASAA